MNTPGFYQYNDALNASATKWNIPLSVLAAVIDHESQYNPSAINYNFNGTVDYGIAQLNSGTFGNSIYTMTPSQQIDAAAQTLAQNFKQLGSWDKAIAAYNTGPSNTDSAAGQTYLSALSPLVSSYASFLGDPNAPTVGSGAGAGAGTGSSVGGFLSPLVAWAGGSLVGVAVAIGALGLVLFSIYSLFAPQGLGNVNVSLGGKHGK